MIISLAATTIAAAISTMCTNESGVIFARRTTIASTAGTRTMSCEVNRGSRLRSAARTAAAEGGTRRMIRESNGSARAIHKPEKSASEMAITAQGLASAAIRRAGRRAARVTSNGTTIRTSMP